MRPHLCWYLFWILGNLPSFTLESFTSKIWNLVGGSKERLFIAPLHEERFFLDLLIYEPTSLFTLFVMEHRQAAAAAAAAAVVASLPLSSNK
jgi:hypothetical protein